MSPTHLNMWCVCKEQFRLRYVEGWVPREKPSYVTFGSLVHDTFEAIYSSSDSVDSVINDYLDKKKDDYSWPGMNRQEKAKTIAMARVLCSKYFEKWDSDDEFEVHGIESRFCEDIPGLGVPIQGVMDLELEDEEGGNWILERKTQSTIDVSKETDLLTFDTQMMLYLIASKQIHGRWPKGIIRDIIRRPGLRKGDTLAEWKKRLQEDVDKRPDHYYVRVKLVLDSESSGKITDRIKNQVIVSTTEIEDWFSQFLKPICEEIDYWLSTGARDHYINPLGLKGKFNQKSDYADAIVRNDYSGLTKIW